MVSGEIFARGIHFRMKAKGAFLASPARHLSFRDMAEMAALDGHQHHSRSGPCAWRQRSLAAADRGPPSERRLLFLIYLQAVGQAGPGGHCNT